MNKTAKTTTPVNKTKTPAPARPVATKKAIKKTGNVGKPSPPGSSGSSGSSKKGK